MVLKKLELQAKTNPQVIIFPEGNNTTILNAVKLLIKNKIAYPLLLGNSKKIKSKLGPVGKYGIIDRKFHEEKLAKKLFKIRKGKINLRKAKKLIKDNDYFSVMMVFEGMADGMISGKETATKNVLIPAFQIIGTKNKKKASGAVLIETKTKKQYIFADCAVNINPNSSELCDIASDAIKTAQFLGITPKVAMLSFSTMSSAKSLEVEKVKKATQKLKKKYPKIPIDGDIQVDAAIVPEVNKQKYNGKGKSKTLGNANILVFPNLDAGNIGCKLVQRFANTKLIGIIVQGLKKPINDLSRGASVEDIYYLTVLTVVQAQMQNLKKIK